MGSIRLDNLVVATEKKTIVKDSVKGYRDSYVYKDLKLDIGVGFINTNEISNIEPTTIDLDFINDLAAIKKSIFNIFNTQPGQKLLNPLLGIDLSPFLFEPVSQEVGESIAESIINGLPRQEPRILLEKLKVTGIPERNEYIVNFGIRIPRLNNSHVNFNGVVSTNGFQFKK